MFPLLVKGIFVIAMIGLADWYYNVKVSQNSDKRFEISTAPPRTTSKITTTIQRPFNTCGPSMSCVPYQRCKSKRGTSLERIDYNDTEKNCGYMERCCHKRWLLPKNKDLVEAPLIYQPSNCSFSSYEMDPDLEYAQQLTLPWTVAILENSFEEKYVCAGALISPRLILSEDRGFFLSVLTAPIYVIAGEFGSNLVPVNPQRRFVTQKIRQDDKQILFNLVTLLVVDRPFYLNANVQPICLPSLTDSSVPTNYGHCLTTAFPLDSYDGMQRSRKYGLEHRRRFYVQQFNDSKCSIMSMMGMLTREIKNKTSPALVCMGREEPGLCVMGPGSPIVCEVGEPGSLIYRLVGLGQIYLTCSPAFPIINVVHYNSWIVQQMQLWT